MVIGEIKRGSELGYKNSTDKFIWIACVDCGKERWVPLLRGSQPQNNRCRSCAGKLSPHPFGPRACHWKGGRYLNNGYVLVYIAPDNFFYSMGTKKANRVAGAYILEHRLVMAEYLKRCLLPWEVVHHKNGVKTDNRIENLKLLSASRYHVPDTLAKVKIARLERRIKTLENRVLLLEAENILLKGLV